MLNHDANTRSDDQHFYGDTDADSRRRLSVAEARAESLERECATLQQSLSEMRDQLERSQHTEQACKRLIEDKNKWLVRLAHDLRSPLSGLRGMADLMLRSLVSPLQKSQLEVVGSTAAEMLDLVGDLLDLSREGAGPHDREDVEFDLDRMLSDAVNSSALAAEKKGTICTITARPMCLNSLPAIRSGCDVWSQIL